MGRGARGRHPERPRDAGGDRQVRRGPAGGGPRGGGRGTGALGGRREPRGARRADRPRGAGTTRHRRPAAPRRAAPAQPRCPARDAPRTRRRARKREVRDDRDRADDGRRPPPGARPGPRARIHLHVGSQLGAVDAWRDAVRRGLAVLAMVRAGRPTFDTFDAGGGFPVGDPGTIPSPARFAAEAATLLDAVPADRRPSRLAVEPGRFLVAGAGWIVASVLHVRDRGEGEPVVVIDAGMTELIRPALYGATHPIRALTSLGNWIGTAAPAIAHSGARVDGPICESTDTLGRHELPPLARGDLVAIAETGAYAASMSSTYNGRPAAPQVLVEADGTLVVGRRGGRVRFGG